MIPKLSLFKPLVFALLGFAVLAAAESIHTGRPESTERERADGMNSPKLPGLNAFFSTLGVVPPIQVSHLTPLADDPPEEVKKWTREMRLWKANTQRLSFLLSTLARASKGKTESESFVSGLEELQNQLNSSIAKVMREEKKAGSLAKLPVNSIGGRVVSDPARKMSEELILLVIAYSESFVEVTEEEPKLPERDRRRLALARLKTRMPKTSLLQVSDADLVGLSEHHQTQIQDLVRLRDALYTNGNFFPFVEQVHQGLKPVKLLLDG